MHRNDFEASELVRQPQTSTAESTSPKHEDRAQDEWVEIIGRIRRGDDQAPTDFVANYVRGARLLFRRQLGTIGTDQLVEETLLGAVEEVRRGWINTPRDLVYFLREVLGRQPGDEQMAPALFGRLGANDKARIRSNAEQIESILRRFSASERLALSRFYLEGESPETIAIETGLSPQAQLELKCRMQNLLRTGGVRNVIFNEPGPLRVRKAAAAGG